MTMFARITLVLVLLALLAVAPAEAAQEPASDPAAEPAFGEFDPAVEAELPPSPAPYRYADAVFYEVVENMRLAGGGPGSGTSLVPSYMQNGATTTSPRRIAKAALTGAGIRGTPFCACPPSGCEPANQVCYLNAFGQDDIDLSTAFGRFSAKVSGVVQGDNLVDQPEMVVEENRVSGRMNMTPALFHQLPYGTVTGRVTSTPARPRFIGVFRLPFLASPAIREILCRATPNPNPHFPGWDIAYIDTTPTGEPTGRCLDILPQELSLGWPTVRFDIWFQ
jgi:hypothetical protein